MRSPFCFVKFGKNLKHLESLQNGNVYFNCISTYRESIEPEIGDKYEGSYEIVNNGFINIEVEHELGNFSFSPINRQGKLIELNENPYLSFSLYALSLENFKIGKEFSIDPRMKDFGDHALMINEPFKFLKMLEIEFKDKEIEYEFGWIEYLDYESDGIIKPNFFNKPNSLSHQNEFRIILSSTENQPKTVQIKSIREFSYLSSSENMISAIFKTN